ncbi:SRPBCC domain-containing protein [Chryseobacterium sp. RP-3-3]|uniref:SRPBCC domain-containing protein n=1 Tax=Chryseobacterium antibioticum TaxID=2728847 RepID=A0A7Y0AQ37_9FLAO|nr:SRPBCC domain-containing protein [Chryseobacterium antibioticum]NML71297.1 SRPBCC domain-containing protein [Chryseobacterium antibioticum]
MDNSFSILHDLEVDSTLENVFRMVSVPEFLNEWWTHYCQGVPEPDSEYTFEFSEKDILKGKISKFNPPYEIEFLITDGDKDWVETSVGFILKEAGNGTKLSFYHTNWKDTNEHFRQTSFCWALYLRVLRKFAEEGLHVPYSERYHF